jgi:enoyl-CoA hydratase
VIEVERDDPIAVVLLNRPKQLNALSDALMDELVSTLRELDEDREIRCIVLGGSERAFAAGADIGELAQASAIELYYARRVERWDEIRSLWTPLVAAVSGFCLGGGCELAMSCDLIVASETAKFGQPETSLGIIPGAGGTQRLTRAVGKALAMDMILSGRMLSAREALAAGLVARVVQREAWLVEAKRVAREIASKGPVATRLAKEASTSGGSSVSRSRPMTRARACGRSARSASPTSKESEMVKVDELLKGARDAISVKKVFGDPVEKDGVTVIPVAYVGGGGGGGGDTEGNGGGGFGLGAKPAGAYVIRDGDVRWEPALNPARLMLGWQIVAALAIFAWLRIARSRR